MSIRHIVGHFLQPSNLFWKRRPQSAIAIIIIYSIFLLLIAIVYFRLLWTVAMNPGYVPRGPQWYAGSKSRLKRKGFREKHKLAVGNNVPAADHVGDFSYANYTANTRPKAEDEASPSLHDFYGKEVFTSEGDGRPIWCSSCSNWKPDRAHHCREIERCVRKMDHFCPWQVLSELYTACPLRPINDHIGCFHVSRDQISDNVLFRVGGVIGERTFKFFLQFVAWASIYCVFTLIVMAIVISEQRKKVRDFTHPVIVLRLNMEVCEGQTSSSCRSAAMSWKSCMLTPSCLAHAKFNRADLTFAGRNAECSLDSHNKSVGATIPYPRSTFLPKSFHSAALFGIFTVAMTGSSLQFAILNTTTIENLTRRNKVWQLAIHMPRPPDPLPSVGFPTITYPLLNATSVPQSPTSKRTFAILHSKPGDNPWYISPYANFQTVMGYHWYDWILPLKYSPCCDHNHPESQFALGPVVQRMREEAGIAVPPERMTEEAVTAEKRRRRRRKSKRESRTSVQARDARRQEVMEKSGDGHGGEQRRI